MSQMKKRAPQVEEYRDERGDHRLVVVGNGRPLVATTEGYRNRADMHHAVRLAIRALLQHEQNMEAIERCDDAIRAANMALANASDPEHARALRVRIERIKLRAASLGSL